MQEKRNKKHKQKQIRLDGKKVKRNSTKSKKKKTLVKIDDEANLKVRRLEMATIYKVKQTGC